MRILVTGGAGFIGSHIVDRLILEGHNVAVIDNLSTGKIENLHGKAKFYKMDIVSPRIEKVFKKEKPELICHHAAQMDVRRSVADPIFDAQINIVGTLNLLEKGLRYGVRRFIFASTGGAIYGDDTPYPTPEDYPPKPLSPYGISKFAGEKYLYFYYRNYGLSYVVLRYANVYGPRQDPFGEAGVVAIFTQKMLRDGQPIINGTGKQTRDYVYVGDVVDAVMACIYSDVVDVFNVGTGIETSVNELFKMLVSIVGKDIKERYGPAKKGEQMRSCLSYEKINKILDWSPRTPLEEGLHRTVEFFRRRM